MDASARIMHLGVRGRVCACVCAHAAGVAQARERHMCITLYVTIYLSMSIYIRIYIYMYICMYIVQYACMCVCVYL
jgi:hypothetical protein